MDLIEKLVSSLRENGSMVGVGGDDKMVPIVWERTGIDRDFDFKTIHHDNYRCAFPIEERRPFPVALVRDRTTTIVSGHSTRTR